MNANSSRLLRKANTAPINARLANNATSNASFITASIASPWIWSTPSSPDSRLLNARFNNPEMSTRVSSQAHSRPTPRPKVAVENPRRV